MRLWVLCDMEPQTEIIGTYGVGKYTIGEVYPNTPIEKFGERMIVTIKILRNSSEQEWRKRYNYNGPLPEGNKPAVYFEVVALD